MLKLNKIYNEDCLLGMKKIKQETIDLVITDPPYGINFNSNWSKNETYRKNLKSVNGILNDKNKEVINLKNL